MLRLTLYKNCILNNTYQNVFSMGHRTNETKSILERYLDTLDSKTFEIDLTYQETSGTLVFDYQFINDNIYEYNYIKIETIEENVVKILRYCFINSIRLKNELVYLNYEEDYWSSYSNKIAGINESYLEKSRVLKYNDFVISPFKIEIDYSGNNKLDIDNIERSLSNLDRKCYIMVQFQIYIPAEQGEISYRRTKYVLLGKKYVRIPGNPEIYGTNFKFDLSKYNDKETATGIIDLLIANQASATKNYQEKDTNSATNFNYEVGNIYFLPEEFDLSKIFDTYEYADPTDYFDSIELKYGWNLDNSYTIYAQKLKENYSMPSILKKQKIYETTILNDFKNAMIGTYLNPQAIDNNGTDLKYEIYMTASNIGFKITAEFMNKVIDITEEFSVSLPFTSITGSENQLRQISKNVKNEELFYQQRINENNANQASAEYFSKSVRKFASKQYLSGITAFGGILTEDANVKYKNKILYLESIENNASAYMTNKAVFTNSSLGVINAYFGICLFKVNPDNENYIKDYINNMGYNIYEFIKNFNLLLINNPSYFLSLPVPINYNTLKFRVVSTYGSFTNEIANILNEILSNGVKIWFNENLEEDNYV